MNELTFLDGVMVTVIDLLLVVLGTFMLVEAATIDPILCLIGIIVLAFILVLVPMVLIKDFGEEA